MRSVDCVLIQISVRCCYTAGLLSSCCMWLLSKEFFFLSVGDSSCSFHFFLQIRYLTERCSIGNYINGKTDLLSRPICHLLIKISLPVFRWWLVLTFHPASSTYICPVLSIFLCLSDCLHCAAHSWHLMAKTVTSRHYVISRQCNAIVTLSSHIGWRKDEGLFRLSK